MRVNAANAQAIVTFGPKETRIDGSIPYSVIGKYKAHFRDFKGMIRLSEDYKRIQSVDLAIKSGSITSNCPWCDKIVCSARLLNTDKYPDIIFKSESIFQDGDAYKVKGVLVIHGIEKHVTLPFQASLADVGSNKDKLLNLQGDWKINRKDFGITWNRFLDHGGVLVGDYLSVSWGIKAMINKEGK